MPQQRKHRDLWFPHAAEVSLVLEPGWGGGGWGGWGLGGWGGGGDLPRGLYSVHFLNRTLAIFRLTHAHPYFSIYRRQSHGIKQKKLYKGMP